MHSPPTTEAPPETGSISGTVREAGVEGPVIQGATVVAFPSGCDCSETETTTNSDGFYSLSLVPGDYFVEVWMEGFEPASANVTIDAAAVTHNFDLAVPPPATFDLTGTVTEDIDGSPLEGASVMVYPDSCDGCDPLHTLTTDGSGSYSVPLPPGDYTVEAWKEGFVSQSLPVTIVDADVVQDFELSPAEITVCVICGEVGPSSVGHTTLKLPAAATRSHTGASPKREVAAGGARQLPVEVPASVRSSAPPPAPPSERDAPAVEQKLAATAERLAPPPPRRSDFGTPDPPRQPRVSVEPPPPDPEPPLRAVAVAVAAEAAPTPP